MSQFDHSHAERLRRRTPLLWSVHLAQTTAHVGEIWSTLGTSQKEGTGPERTITAVVHEKAADAMEILARVLALQVHDCRHFDGLREWRENHRSWLCYMAVSRAVCSPRFTTDGEIAQTLPGLLEVIAAVQRGDSQTSVAERCVWPAPKPALAKGA